jgi:regulator of protease activity HflC (stomatin/prohibitin superfamily)
MYTDRFKNEYPGLSTISIIFKVIGIIIILFAVIALIYGLSLLGEYGDERQLGVYLIISALVSGLLFSIPFFAFAELIKLFVRIEFNTRKEKDDEITKRFDSIGQKQKSPDSGNNDISYEDWIKDNLGKTINDYYASRK